MWLYHVRFSNAEEVFEKIGITSKSVQERFGIQYYLTYDIEVLNLIKGDELYIRGLEKQLLSDFKELSYTPLNENFKGKHECFLPYEIFLPRR